MVAGNLDQRWQFQKRTSTDDGYGNKLAAWAAQFTVWASREDLRGGETVMASRLEGRQPCLIRVRASSQSRTITPDWRAVNLATGEAVNVRTATQTPDRRFMELLCEAGVADG